jgi:hypothetical protein
MGIRPIPKIYPASPDTAISRAKESEAAPARLAHLNKLIAELNDIKHYELDMSLASSVEITSSKGIIDITGIDAFSPPDPDTAFGSYVIITLVNPAIVAAGVDNTYVQVTPYYNPAMDDWAIPYLMPIGGGPTGLNVAVYNASPTPAGANQWTGAFYIYYEIKTL